MLSDQAAAILPAWRRILRCCRSCGPMRHRRWPIGPMPAKRPRSSRSVRCLQHRLAHRRPARAARPLRRGPSDLDLGRAALASVQAMTAWIATQRHWLLVETTPRLRPRPQPHRDGLGQHQSSRTGQPLPRNHPPSRRRRPGRPATCRLKLRPVLRRPRPHRPFPMTSDHPISETSLRRCRETIVNRPVAGGHRERDVGGGEGRLRLLEAAGRRAASRWIERKHCPVGVCNHMCGIDGHSLRTVRRWWRRPVRRARPRSQRIAARCSSRSSAVPPMSRRRAGLRRSSGHRS